MLAKLKRFREIIFIAVAVLLAVVYFVISPGIDNVVLHRQGKDVASALPITLAMNQGEPFAVDMDITSGIGGDFTLDIHPDDCVTSLRVNGTDLPFRNYPGHCSWNQGFILDKSEIERHVGKGHSNFHIEIALRNNGGPGGINAEFKSSGFLMSFLTVLFVLIFLAGYYVLDFLDRVAIQY